MVCWKRKVAGGWPRNFLFMDLGYEDEEEFEDVAWPCPTCTNAYPAVADMRLEDLRGFKDHGNHGTKRITGPGCESITKIYIKYKHYKQSEYSQSTQSAQSESVPRRFGNPKAIHGSFEETWGVVASHGGTPRNSLFPNLEGKLLRNNCYLSGLPSRISTL